MSEDGAQILFTYIGGFGFGVIMGIGIGLHWARGDIYKLESEKRALEKRLEERDRRLEDDDE